MQCADACFTRRTLGSAFDRLDLSHSFWLHCQQEGELLSQVLFHVAMNAQGLGLQLWRKYSNYLSSAHADLQQGLCKWTRSGLNQSWNQWCQIAVISGRGSRALELSVSHNLRKVVLRSFTIWIHSMHWCNIRQSAKFVATQAFMSRLSKTMQTYLQHWCNIVADGVIAARVLVFAASHFHAFSQQSAFYKWTRFKQSQIIFRQSLMQTRSSSVPCRGPVDRIGAFSKWLRLHSRRRSTFLLLRHSVAAIARRRMVLAMLQWRIYNVERAGRKDLMLKTMLRFFCGSQQRALSRWLDYSSLCKLEVRAIQQGTHWAQSRTLRCHWHIWCELSVSRTQELQRLQRGVCRFAHVVCSRALKRWCRRCRRTTQIRGGTTELQVKQQPLGRPSSETLPQ